MDDFTKRENAAWEALLARLEEIYGKAVRRIIKRSARLWESLRAIEDGRVKPPEIYTEEQRGAWVQAHVDMALQESRAEHHLGEELAAAGVAAAVIISSAMIDSYLANRRWALARIDAQLDKPLPWPTLTERQVRIIIENAQPVGEKIAYRNLGSSPTFIRRFQREMVAAARGGESQRDLVQRIMRAMGETGRAAYRKAELIAQTERTRVQSQARWEADEEAISQGIRVADIWLCQNIPPHRTSSGWSSGSRDSHRALHREARIHGQSWTTIHGHTLRYPGDPSAPASEICRCHCALEPRVLLAGEDVVDGRIVRRD